MHQLLVLQVVLGHQRQVDQQLDAALAHVRVGLRRVDIAQIQQDNCNGMRPAAGDLDCVATWYTAGQVSMACNAPLHYVGMEKDDGISTQEDRMALKCLKD
jgi:hypothetical protein